MWTLPGPKLAMIYNVLTVLLAIPCCYVLMRLILSDLSGRVPGGSAMVVGVAWITIPLLGLAGVAISTLPSVPWHTRSLLSAISFVGVTLLAALPLLLMFAL